ncbi:salicylate hydroxylase [Coprinopsis marcescibilis]|uniref:Salicylate hydroxylase n=1 Tax=Coprinopsis marcescibilis TaxID=230819 RepID=A0A5C3KD80_COPMA|nr:salicylate hydroxylase [Coprinopsis marcescibilis]
MPSGPKFRVAICGGGIGGLTAAIILARSQDIEVEIYESAQKLTEIGAGIGLFSRPWEIIRKIGLDEELLKTTAIKPVEGPVSSFKYRRSDRPEGLEFYTLVTKGNLMTFHRADFQAALLRKLPRSCRVNCSKRLRSYTQHPSGPIELLFEDGTTTTCDVLLGADGLKSAVRRSMMNEKAQTAQSSTEAAEYIASIDPLWCGQNAYRELIPAERLNARCPNHRVFTQPTQYLGKNGYIIAYPIQKGKMINFVAFTARHDLEDTKFNGAWVCPTDSSEVTTMFRKWEPEAQALLDCIDRPLRWAIHTVRPLSSYSHGRVALLGDAAHASPPHQGSGAAMAIEDAFVLATLLIQPGATRETLPRVLSIYDHVRRPVDHDVHNRNRINGQYFTFHNVDLDPSLPDEHLLPYLQHHAQKFTKNWEWAWLSSAAPVMQEAMQLLNSSS